MERLTKAIAIDFDGCLCENKWPEIGEPNWDVIKLAILEQVSGASLILWTCRTGHLLTEAIEACEKWGLTFDAVNENLPERIKSFGSDSRKISADEYWDDCAVHMPEQTNDPLTLEELREMDGEPVWAVNNRREVVCALTYSPCSIVYLTFGDGTHWDAEDLLDEGCKIYRRKPEEEAT